MAFLTPVARSGFRSPFSRAAPGAGAGGSLSGYEPFAQRPETGLSPSSMVAMVPSNDLPLNLRFNLAQQQQQELRAVSPSSVISGVDLEGPVPTMPPPGPIARTVAACLGLRLAQAPPPP